ncbi:MAG: ftsQ [Ramlibacter sp.]|jgi:cell division protein FtsQ|uniref:cell division protein FtsQ/DivIB n=1 Tax=Ramlibacter sp. TaxID=1917967 RepID=UPI002626B7D8|nr:cell division protein FtsQ/DivIB [Ramlibacter sp.]MDB5752667.1 ftsQ [Ramlibacter sp.]
MKHALPQPVDVKLMNLTASVLFVACAVLLAAALGWWLLRHPLFAVGGITVQGDLEHNSVATLRANVAPRLAGNFFTLDLQRARAAFESVPWVRQATVRRQFPNRLRVQLQEHQPLALWGAEAESRMVNTFGEVFEADPGELDEDELPRLNGPDGAAPQVLAMYRGLQPLFEPMELRVEQLALTNRGGWTLKLDSGAVVELGRGTQDEVLARSQRFARTLTQVTSKYGRRPEALVTADLRHRDGYAVRLRGVGTTDVQTQRN